MKTFNNYFELLLSIYNDGFDVKVRDKHTKELLNVNLTLYDPTDCIFYANNTKRKYEYVLKYLMGELAWYMNGSNNIKDILKYSKFWNNVCTDVGTVNSNYGYHVFKKLLDSQKTNYENCVDLLRVDSHCRQAIMLYNEPYYMFNNSKDYICTQVQQFFIRDDILHSTIYIRSSDAIFGLTYDIPWWSFVMQQMALDLDVKVGSLCINIGSSHIYSQFYDYCFDLKKEDVRVGRMWIEKVIPLHKSFDWYEKKLDEYFMFERDKIELFGYCKMGMSSCRCGWKGTYPVSGCPRCHRSFIL